MFRASSSKDSDTREYSALHRFTQEHADRHQQDLGEAGQGFWSRGETVLLAVLTGFPEDSW